MIEAEPPVSEAASHILSDEDPVDASELLARVEAVLQRWNLDPRCLDEVRATLGGTPSKTWFDTEGHGSASPTERSSVPGVRATVTRRGLVLDIEGRYEDLGLIGLGGMGEVRRVRDRRLGRVVAMKILRAEHLLRPQALTRFLEEAQVSAQLDHPSIVPVHDIGRLQDGRSYFTMQEVRGRTLSDILRELHKASAGDRWASTTDGWTLRRVLEAFRRVCDAVAYAHARGVLHRDLKPENVMLGAFGEVLVMDWGLAKVGDKEAPPADLVELPDERYEITRSGMVAGTPAYMAPEQARGELGRMGPRTDVYALGAILYEILEGRSPYPGKNALQRVLEGPPPPLGERARGRRQQPGPLIPRTLRTICARAMSREPDGRPASASVLGDAIGEWLDGARRREQALAHVREADNLAPQVAALRERARGLRKKASAILALLPHGAEAEEKRPAWRLADEAEALDREAELRNVDVVQALRAALADAPDTAEAHERLAAHYQERHAAAELRRDAAGVAALEALLRAHDTGPWSAYLAGYGELSLDPGIPGTAQLFRYVERDRRLIPEAFGKPLPLPVRRLTVQHGSWLAEIRQEEGPSWLVPALVGRQQSWPPDAPGDRAVVAATPSRLAAGERFIPEGWTWLGGDPAAVQSAARSRVWVGGYVMLRDLITNAEYAAFLLDVLRRDGTAAALRHAPRVGGLPTDGYAGLRFQITAEGVDLGPEHGPDVPVTSVDWASAVAYAAWRAAKEGLPWRLPTETEWEKAGRGVDGRYFPWGDLFDVSFCRVRSVHRTARSPDPADAWPADTSPYGIRGLAGNAREWCSDVFQPDGPWTTGDPGEDPWADARSVRGGSWARDAARARLACRDWEPPETRAPDLGFRLVRSL
jgi:serine/threonine-protein kinase